VVGFVASVLFSEIWGAIFTAKGNAGTEEAVHENVKKMGRKIEEQSERFENQKERALGEARDARSTAVARVWSAGDADEIQQVEAWARDENQAVPSPPRRSDRSLYKSLLQDWVLERSGDAKSAGKGTNRPAYRDARATAFDHGEAGPENRRDLFVYQARHEWSKLSLGGIPGVEDELQAKIADYEMQGRQAGLDGPDLAQFVLNMLGPEQWQFFEMPDPFLTAKLLQQINVNVEPEEFRHRRLSCQFWLQRDGSSIIVTSFMYHLDGFIGERRPK